MSKIGHYVRNEPSVAFALRTVGGAATTANHEPPVKLGPTTVKALKLRSTQPVSEDTQTS